MKHIRKQSSPRDSWPHIPGASSWWLKARGKVTAPMAEEVIVSMYPTISRITGSLHIFHTPTFGVDLVENLHSVHGLSVPSGAEKLVSISIFDTATREAQNASLKLLEEPPTDHVLIFITPSTTKLLPTVASRMQHADIVGELDMKLAESFASGTIPQRMKMIEGWMKLYDAKEVSRHEILSWVLTAYEMGDSTTLDPITRNSILKSFDIITSTDGSVKVALEALSLLLPQVKE